MNSRLGVTATTDIAVLAGVGPCDVIFKCASASILDFGFRISDF